MIIDGVKIERVTWEGKKSLVEDTVAVDASFCIFLDGLPFRTLISSPDMFRELAIGHLLSEGVISSLDGISDMSITPGRADISLKKPFDVTDFSLTRDRVITTACNVEAPPSDILGSLRVPETTAPDDAQILDLVEKLNRETPTFRATGGTHSALLYCRRTGFNVCAEDVGRHNAVDKVLGAGLIEGVSFNDCILASSGRLSGEIVLKAARAEVPDLCSVSAPLASGINVAHQTGVRLYGFVRARRLNRYL
jgi:FdhD protein